MSLIEHCSSEFSNKTTKQEKFGWYSDCKIVGKRCGISHESDSLRPTIKACNLIFLWLLISLCTCMEFDDQLCIQCDRLSLSGISTPEPLPAWSVPFSESSSIEHWLMIPERSFCHDAWTNHMILCNREVPCIRPTIKYPCNVSCKEAQCQWPKDEI